MATNTNTLVTDRIDDVIEVIRILGRSIETGTIDKEAALNNLFIAMRKLEDLKRVITQR
jgi:hypothetical protein